MGIVGISLLRSCAWFVFLSPDCSAYNMTQVLLFVWRWGGENGHRREFVVMTLAQILNNIQG
jgi:hypothetical protein